MTLRAMLTGNRFAYGAEVVSSRGLQDPAGGQGLAAFCRALLDDPRIGWISITDNPGGGPMLPPDWMAGLVADRRERVVIHLTCKDMNRNGLEAAAWRYASEGFDNILALTGDYPTGGFGGTAQPVFDLDSLGLIKLLRSMNEGLKVAGRSGAMETLPPTHFYIGCAVSPFKRYERELMPQYFKLLRKIRAGAEWVLPQLGYDMRKFHEVKLFLEARGVQAPVVGNVYRLTKGVARLFHERQAGRLRGLATSCWNGREILGRARQGAEVRQRAGRQAIGRVQGAGVRRRIPGRDHQARNVRRDHRPGRKLRPRRLAGLPPRDPVLPARRVLPLRARSRYRPERLDADQPRVPWPRCAIRPSSKQVTLGYRLSRRVHALAFARGKGLYGLMTRIFRRLDAQARGLMSRLAYWLERQAKQLGYACKDCGDCSLPDCAYLCPMAACSKGSRNGPCGGSARAAASWTTRNASGPGSTSG